MSGDPGTSQADASLTDTSLIRDWQSIVTLVVFVFTNIIVLFPFRIPVYIPRRASDAVLDALGSLRIIPRRQDSPQHGSDDNDRNVKVKPFVRLDFHMNFVTAPLIADLFLLALSAIGRAEVYGGTIGADGINPIEIMTFFLTLAYIAISIDASGLVRYLAFRVLLWGGNVGHRLFLYLYAFFFGLGTFIGNDPIILSGTAFLAYMTRIASNIVHPRAWIHTQFAVANIASAILVSSNPTNLVLAGAFNIKFLVYTYNMIVPVIVTAIVLFPFLLYIIFANESLIPFSIKMHELPEEARGKAPVNPNIPNARRNVEEEEGYANSEQGKLLSLEEIMNPFLDKGGAAFGAIIMAVTLVTVLALNAVSQSNGEYPVFYVTLPAAFVMFCWDVAFGWLHRHETREIARKSREEAECLRAERANRERIAQRAALEQGRDAVATDEPGLTRKQLPEIGIPSRNDSDTDNCNNIAHTGHDTTLTDRGSGTKLWHTGHRPLSALHVSESGDALTLVTSPSHESSASALAPEVDWLQNGESSSSAMSRPEQNGKQTDAGYSHPPQGLFDATLVEEMGEEKREMDMEKEISHEVSLRHGHAQPTLVSLAADAYVWSQETFPTVMAVLAHLPFALVPFALCMFVLVQALVTKGWVAVFAYGWDHWVDKTGTVGSIGSMGFLSVILCNFAGTNIGTTILLSRVIQAWVAIHNETGVPISNRTFWATVYSMALGVNYGAFSTAFSASLAGLLWRDILARKHIRVRRLEFARVNLPIIAVAMTVGCVILIGEVYIFRDNSPYVPTPT